MEKLVRRAWVVVLAAIVLAVVSPWGRCASFAPAFFDSFDNMDLWGWSQGPWSGTPLADQDLLWGDYGNRTRTPCFYSARESVGYRVAVNSKQALPKSYSGDVYLTCWVYEDNDIPYPIPVPAQGYHTDEEWPNGGICLENAEGTDSFILGVLGYQGYAKYNPKDPPTYGCNRSYFDDLAIYTTTDGYKALDGTQEAGMPASPRRQGWRKLTIVLDGSTGKAGDVQFFVDDQLVFDGRRATSPKGPVPVDTVILGAPQWTMETYWFSQVELDSTTFSNKGTTTSFRNPLKCATIAEAERQPDGTWVSLEKVVTGDFTSRTLSWSQGGGTLVGGVLQTPDHVTQATVGAAWPGYFAIEDENQQSNKLAESKVRGLWVSSSYQAQVDPSANTGERVRVVGRMRTNEGGMRYLEAFQVTRLAVNVNQPDIVQATLAQLNNPALNGMLVKIRGKVVDSDTSSVIGQEPQGDWRRYITIDDASGNGPVKCYYDNIMSTDPSNPNPIPNVSLGDFVSVVGLVGNAVPIPGVTSQEKTVWIRGTGDLFDISQVAGK